MADPQASEKIDLSEVMLAMDVVDTLRHERSLVDREFQSEDREAELTAKLRKIYADQALQKLHSMKAEALDKEAMRKNGDDLAQSQKALDDIEGRIEAEEAKHASLLERRSQFSSGADDISRQAIELQISQIRNDSLANLYMQAKMTPKPDDDVIVNRIRDLQQEGKRIEARIDTLKSHERQHQQSSKELEDLSRQYRRSGYDSGYSTFPSGFDLAALLAMMMSGRSSGRDVWDLIDREQRFRRPRTPRELSGGLFPGGLGGGSGGGGFRTGGGFGILSSLSLAISHLSNPTTP